MKITQKMIQEGWKKDPLSGDWVAPHESGIQVARYDTNGRKERINIVETTTSAVKERVDIVEAARTEPADKAGQVSAFQRLGLSRAAAEVAAGVSRPVSDKEVDAQQWRDAIIKFGK